MNAETTTRGGGRLVVLVVLTASTLAGCSAIRDMTASIKFNPSKVLNPPDPLQVIATSANGDERADAYRALREPRQQGGSAEQQAVVLKALRYGATTDPQSLCRMAAIDVLGRFRDPEASKILTDAYYKAGSFLPETATVIRCHSLQALGSTRDPEAVEFLVKVLREPPVEGPDQDRQQKLDERIAAAGALGRFNQPQATAALAVVLEKEDDVVLRKRAHASLVEATGRDLPADGATWNNYLTNPNSREALAAEPGVVDRFLRLTGLGPTAQQAPQTPQARP